jgi:cytochrome c oxidase subunit 2
VEFHVRSKDVIHDFWVPEFRQKIDAVPGITTKYRITPNRLGAYPVVCAELCGLGHSTMRQTVHVLPQQEFDSWMSRKVAQASKRT